MKTKDALTTHYSLLLEGEYDCIDRIVLNAYCPMLLVPGGVRNWYRLMEGDDKDMSNNTMIRYAGRVSRRVQSFCKKKGIPFIHFQTGERKHIIAEQLIPKDKNFTGFFAVFVSRAPSLLWDIKKFDNGSIDIRRKEKTSLVNHYYFHIIDKEWGHITVRMCAHPPFSTNIILNGHEWVERRQGFKSIHATKEGNCFTSYNNGKKLTRIADTLKTKGQFEQVCQRWIYSCLWFAMDKKQQERTGIKYKFSVYQIEYSRNLLFKRGRQMDEVYQNIIDLTRSRLDLKRLKTIFGKKRRPFKCNSTAPAPEVCIETPDYNLTIFKIHFGRLTVKLYDKGERTLRAEVVVHNTKDLNCHRSLVSIGEVIGKLEEIMGNFLNNLDYAHAATIDDGAFEEICKPTQTGQNRLAGIDFNKTRIAMVARAMLILSMKPGGFTSRDMSEILSVSYDENYSCRNASYDIKKFRGKGLVTKVPNTIKYQLPEKGIKLIAAILCILNKEAPSIASLLCSEFVQDKELLEIDKCLFAVKKNIDKLNEIHGLKIAA
jgi:hypothetical protein